MKLKPVVKKIGILALFFVLALQFSACGDKMKKYAANISEIRDNVFEAQSAAMNVNAITGKREEPFILDGHAAGMRAFTLIVIEPADYKSGMEYKYTAVINGSEYTGNMNPHPFGKSYSADINIEADGSPISLKLESAGYIENFELISVKTPDMISAGKALNIAASKLKKQINSITSGKNLNAEIYIRLMANPIDAKGGYHWYVAFISDAQIIYAVLIEPVSMQIVAIRN